MLLPHQEDEYSHINNHKETSMAVSCGSAVGVIIILITILARGPVWQHQYFKESSDGKQTLLMPRVWLIDSICWPNIYLY